MYVQRDNHGNIVAAFANAQDYASEQLADSDVALIAFLTLPAQPDGAGFIQAVKNALGGILAANALMVSYPAFMPAAQQGNWADLQALIIDANSKAVISTAQYAGMKAAAQQFHIPIALP